jgi:hypothetical protein
MIGLQHLTARHKSRTGVGGWGLGALENTSLGLPCLVAGCHWLSSPVPTRIQSLPYMHLSEAKSLKEAGSPFFRTYLADRKSPGQSIYFDLVSHSSINTNTTPDHLANQNQ